MEQSPSLKTQPKKASSFLEKVVTKTNKALKSQAEWDDKVIITVLACCFVTNTVLCYRYPPLDHKL